MAGRRRLSILLLLPLVLVGLAACGGDDDDDASSDETTTTAADDTEDTADDEGDEGEAGEYTITATDYEFDAPTELDAGVHTLTLENEGESTHEAGFIKLGEDLDAEGFAEIFGPVLEGGPIDDVLEEVTGVTETPGGESVTSTVTLGEGTWALFCAISDEPEDGAEGEEEGASDAAQEEAAPAHYTLGMYEIVEVSGGDVSTDDLPETDGTLTASDYEFEFDVEEGDQEITFVNDGPDQIHHAVLMAFEGLDETEAEEAVKTLLASEEGGPPPEGTPEPEEVGGSYVFSPGNGGTFEVPGGFESGKTYVALCFLQDREGGPPHAIAHDMVTAFAIQ